MHVDMLGSIGTAICVRLLAGFFPDFPRIQCCETARALNEKVESCSDRPQMTEICKPHIASSEKLRWNWPWNAQLFGSQSSITLWLQQTATCQSRLMKVARSKCWCRWWFTYDSHMIHIVDCTGAWTGYKKALPSLERPCMLDGDANQASGVAFGCKTRRLQVGFGRSCQQKRPWTSGSRPDCW